MIALQSTFGEVLRGRAQFNLVDEHPFRLVVANSPRTMETLLREELSARMTAGYCWPWSPFEPDGQLVPDVRIGDWHRPWNAKISARRGNVPSSLQWATADGGFEQIGCVYTAPGLEYDWGGVIFGEDLVWRDGQWKGNLAASRDRKVKQGATHEAFERSVRNAYRVLLTRSMCGTVIYSVDPETQELFTLLVPQHPDLSTFQCLLDFKAAPIWV